MYSVVMLLRTMPFLSAYLTAQMKEKNPQTILSGYCVFYEGPCILKILPHGEIHL